MGSEHSAWISGFEPKRSDMVFERQQPSCYTNQLFEDVVSQTGSFAIAGLVAEESCLATAIDAAHRGHHVTFLSDASVSRWPARCRRHGRCMSLTTKAMELFADVARRGIGWLRLAANLSKGIAMDEFSARRLRNVIPVLVEQRHLVVAGGVSLCRPSDRSGDHADSPVAARYFRGRACPNSPTSLSVGLEPRERPIGLIREVSRCRNADGSSLRVLFAARAATGFQFQSVGSVGQSADAGSWHGLCRDRHAARRLSAAGRRRRVSDRPARPAFSATRRSGLPASLLMAVSGLALSYSGDLRDGAGCAHRRRGRGDRSSAWSRPRWWRTGSTPAKSCWRCRCCR